MVFMQLLGKREESEKSEGSAQRPTPRENPIANKLKRKSKCIDQPTRKVK
jgi:hypothetical protein